jgi:hypothetical protein
VVVLSTLDLTVREGMRAEVVTCRVIDLGNGHAAIACSRGHRKRCATPGCTGYVAKLCDYPVTRGGKQTTCDRGMCPTCAHNVGPDRDFCGPHRALLAVEGAPAP